jgi:hypothetical protein
MRSIPIHEIDEHYTMYSKIFYTCVMQRGGWDGDQPDDYRYCLPYESLYGIVMEFPDDSEQGELRRADLALLENIAGTLTRIHSAVLHSDISVRKILLVEENGIS